jgi:hypothetical protein
VLMFLGTLFSSVSTMIVIVASTPIFAVVIVPLAFVYVFVQVPPHPHTPARSPPRVGRCPGTARRSMCPCACRCVCLCACVCVLYLSSVIFLIPLPGVAGMLVSPSPTSSLSSSVHLLNVSIPPWLSLVNLSSLSHAHTHAHTFFTADMRTHI